MFYLAISGYQWHYSHRIRDLNPLCHSSPQILYQSSLSLDIQL